MPITESKVRQGTLTLGGLPFATQATSVRLVPDTKEVGDPLEALSGDTLDQSDETTWSLVIRAVQDFEDPAGITNWLYENAGEEEAFVWAPQGVTGPSYSGSVRVRPMPVGGEVNTRLLDDVTMPITTGKPARAEAA